MVQQPMHVHRNTELRESLSHGSTDMQILHHQQLCHRSKIQSSVATSILFGGVC